MKLTDLAPHFLRYERRDGQVYFCDVPTIGEAQGVMFLCPGCFAKNGGPVGTHAIICWSRSRGVPDDATPTGRWRLDGSGVADLTLNADPPAAARSVLLLGGCKWHGFVTRGEVTTA